MKKPIPYFIFFITVLLFVSCRNKTVLLLTKKWDCVQVDNIKISETKTDSSKDAVNTEQLKSLLQSISWTFKDRMKYECAINGSITVQGKYALLEHDQVMVCTSASKNSVNRYSINTLTEQELVLSGNAGNINLVLHFKPH